MRRVLVTGASGFVGRHVLFPLLERGFEVHCVSRRSSGPADGTSAASWHQVDLLDPRAADELVSDVGPSHLLHLAWYAEHGRYWTASENLDWVAASLRLLRQFREAGGRRAVVAGTCAEYDWSGDCCNNDSTALAPRSLYGISKNALRQVLEGYSRTSGLSSAWGRIFFTFGPGEQPTRVVASVARAAVLGKTVACSPGTQVRDFLYVADVAAAFAALVDSELPGAVDIGSGRPLALRDLLLRLETLARQQGLVRFGDRPPSDEPARIVADVRRLRDELGWGPAVTLDEGLAETLAWWRRELLPAA